MAAQCHVRLCGVSPHLCSCENLAAVRMGLDRGGCCGGAVGALAPSRLVGMLGGGLTVAVVQIDYHIL